MRVKSPDIKIWMVSLLKHFSWLFAKVFISGKLFAKVLILCKILKQGSPQGIILLFSFIFLLMPPINHELLRRCQRAACLSSCKWQAVNNAHRPHREAPKSTACRLWTLVHCRTMLFSGAWFLPVVRWVPCWPVIRNRQITVHGSWGQANHWGTWITKKGATTPKRTKLENSRESSQHIWIFSRVVLIPYNT